jgi:ribosome-associated protein
MQRIQIETDVIRLDQLLKLSTIADSGGFAKLLIKEGFVSVNGEICLQRGKKVHAGDQIRLELPTEEGGHEVITLLVTQ